MTNDASKLIHADISYEIIGALFEVDNGIGRGHRENVYQRAVEKALRDRKLNVKREVYHPVFFKGERVGSYYFDFLVDGKVILELKSGKYFSRHNISQVKEYLEISGLQLAILANFTPDGVKHMRIVNLHDDVTAPSE